MIYDFVTNLSTCGSPESIFQFLGTTNFGIIYYTHIPVICISLLIGIIVLIKNRNDLLSKILFALSSFFIVWCILDIFTWVSFNSQVIMFNWALTGIFQVLIYLTSLYFIYVFINKKDLPFYQKVIMGLLFLPIVIMTPTTYNLAGFIYDDCTAIDMTFMNYIYIVQLLISAWLLIVSMIGIIKSKGEERKEIIFASLGIIFFLTAFFITGFLSIYLANQNILTGYSLESYGLFGMVIFMAFLTYLIVKFKIFNIKLIGAQALVWGLVILIGSQFFYLENADLPSKIITSSTLVVASILGLAVVRGVKKEILLKEQLQSANAGQKNLIHIMNHQIKGHLGKNKNIFAELLTDDYGVMPEAAKPLLQVGLDESDAGVQYVTQILNGASAESGMLQYDMQTINYSEIVKEVAEKERDLAEKKGLKFDVKINGDYMTLGDVKQLNEATRNLIENSIYYTPSGNIWVNLEEKGGKIVLSVKDTGVGIKAEDRDRLFRAGGVTKDSLKVNVKSSGYGLVFVKGVVETHNGRVWFESEGAGKGSTFFLELPLK